MMARALALNGAHKVYIVGRRLEKLEKVAASVTTGNIIPLVGDVTSKEAIQSVVSHIEKDVGYVNVVIANSGVIGPKSKDTATLTLSEFAAQELAVDFDTNLETFSVNVTAVWFTFISFLELLDKGNKKGNVVQRSQVIATSSIASFNRSVPGGYAYGQSKAGTTALVKQLATKLVPYGIRSNAICPGLYPSEMTVDMLHDKPKEFPTSQIPLQRVGTEEDMAGTVLFLTSQAGAYLNGNMIITDGGRLSVMPSTY
jgi:NAD(P)-dependent dehydrogenase (short-subunit alcohol dehydrogenase family)